MIKLEKEKVKKILFITLSNLGDIVLTTPVLEKLHEGFPDAKIDIVTGAAGEELFKGHPGVGRIIVPPRPRSLKNRISQVIDFNKNRYDLVIDLKNSLIPYIIGAKLHSDFSLSDKIIHKKDEHLSKLKFLDLDDSGKDKFYLPASAGDEDKVNDILGKSAWKRTVIINPGSKSHLKRWPAIKYAYLADRLIRELGCRILIIGATEDAKVVQEMIKAMREHATNLCAKTSLSLLAELMRRVDLVVTNDSAPLHIASAVNIPTVAVFASTDPRKYGPLADNSLVVLPEAPCRPCERSSCTGDPQGGCITNISVDEVFAAAKDVLEGVPTEREYLEKKQHEFENQEFPEENQE